MSTQTEAMKLALEAGFWRENINTWMCSTEDIELFAELVRAEALAEQPAPEMAIADAYRAGVDSGIAAEREACAKVCEEIGEESDSFTRDILRSTAAAIRARGNT